VENAAHPAEKGGQLGLAPLPVEKGGECMGGDDGLVLFLDLAHDGFGLPQRLD